MTYIEISATAHGVDDNFAFYLLSIANASSFFGRLSAGFLADRIGAISVMAPFTAVAAVLTYIWPFVNGVKNYVAIAIVYGLVHAARSPFDHSYQSLVLYFFKLLLRNICKPLGCTDDRSRRNR